MQDIDAAYLFQDIGDIDDDLSSLLVPDLDFTGLNDMYTPSVKKPPPVQTGDSPLCFLNLYFGPILPIHVVRLKDSSRSSSQTLIVR